MNLLWRYSYLFGFKVDDASKLASVQRSSAHQDTINVFLCHQLVDGVGRDGTSVKDTRSVRRFLVKHVGQDTTASGVDALGDFGSSAVVVKIEGKRKCKK